jgi:hypothetical protein
VCIPHPGPACPDLIRCDRREAVLAGDQDRRRFLETLEHQGKGDPRKGPLALEWRASQKYDDTTNRPRNDNTIN